MSKYDDALALLTDPRSPAARAGTAAETPDDVAALQRDADIARKDQRLAAENFVKANTTDAPLDVTSGLPAGLRAKLSFERTPERQAKWLAQQPGILGVRKATDGTLIARVAGEQGAPRDVLVDERKFTGADLADMAGDAPVAAASLAAAAWSGGLSLLPQAAITAGAGALTGAAQDAMVRTGAGLPVDPGEIALSRGAQMGIDAAIPLGIGGSKRLAQLLVGKSHFAGPLENEAAAAAARLRATTGAPIELTAAQASGNPMLARAEAFASKVPGGNVLTDQAARQDQALRAAQAYILGGDPATVPAEALIGQKAGEVLAKGRAGALTGVQAERTAAQAAAERDLRALLDAKLVPGNITPSEAGQALRGRVQGLRDQFKENARKLYDAAYISAGGKDLAVPMKPVTDLLAGIKGDTSEAAQALMPEIRNLLGVGEKLPAALPLNQARELRSLIADKLGQGDAMPGIPDRYLSKLHDALTTAIDGGVKAAPNPDVGRALAAANKYYRENAWKYTQPGVSELFSVPGQKSFLGDSQVARRIFAGEGNVDLLRRYRDLLGPASTEYRAVLRGGLNEVLERSRFGGDFVKADELLSSLKAMNPEFRREVLGPIEKELLATNDLLRVAQSTGNKLSTDDVERVLGAKPGAAADTLRAMLQKQRNVDGWYNRKIVRELTDGQFNPAEFNADEFVTRFVNNSSAEEARQVLAQLRVADPTLPEQIKRRTMLNLLERTQAPIKADALAERERLGTLSMEKLARELRGPDAEKLQVILGKDAVDNLRDVLLVQASREKSKNAAGAAGSLVTSNILASLMEFTPGEIPRILKNRIMAGVLVSPGLKTLATGLVNIPATPRARLAVMASPPIMRAIVDEFKNEPDQLGQVLDAMRTSAAAKDPATPRASYDDALNLLR